MKNTLVIALLVSFFLPACKDSKTNPQEKEKMTDSARKEATANKPEQPGQPPQQKDPGEFSIAAPAGWTRVDTAMMGQTIVFIKSAREGADDDFIENVNVLTEKVGSVGMEEYLDRSLRNLENGLTGYEQGKISDKNINGMEFKSVRYSHNYSGTPIDVEAYFTLHNGTAYILTCSAKGGDISRWEPEFEQVIRSFKLN